MLNATVTASSRFQTPEEFRNIIVKAESSGARVRLSDVARVELGVGVGAEHAHQQPVEERSTISSSVSATSVGFR